MTQKFSRRDVIRQAQGLVLATPFLSLPGCAEDGAGELVTLDGRTMGTSYSVKLAAVPRDLDRPALAGEVDALLQAVDRRMSTYRPDSELSRFNAAAAGSWTAVSADTRSVIEQALRVSRLTGGAFDPSVGPLVDLWGFGPGARQERVPSSSEITGARAAVDFTRIETRGERPAAVKHGDGLRLDLSGVAKGYGVDKVAEHLAARGLANYLVEVGGELRARGQGPGGRPWRVGIEKPTGAPGDLQRVVDLEGAALATSGNYRIFFELDGRRYSHIVDPVTGHPVAHDLASATVVAATTAEADALSTSLLVLGPEAGMRLAEAQGVAALFITGRAGAYAETASTAFKRRFEA